MSLIPSPARKKVSSWAWGLFGLWAAYSLAALSWYHFNDAGDGAIPVCTARPGVGP